MQNETQFSQEYCNFGSISFQMLSEVLRARSFSILDALHGESIDVPHIRRLATHMSLSADDLINVTGLTNPYPEQRQGMTVLNVANNPEPSSLLSVFELSKIAAERRLKERSIRLVFEPLNKDQFIAGNPWEVSWVLFFILNRLAIKTQGNPAHTTELNIDVTHDENMVDVSLVTKIPLKPVERPAAAQPVTALLSELEWYCLSQIIRKNDLYLMQKEVVSECGATVFKITLRVPTFQPGFE